MSWVWLTVFFEGRRRCRDRPGQRPQQRLLWRPRQWLRRPPCDGRPGSQATGVCPELSPGASGRLANSWRAIPGLFGALAAAGCSGVFFYPDQVVYLTPERLPTPVEEVFVPSAEGVLHAWWMPAAAPRGAVFFLHGNAQNLTSHVLNVAWLPASGYSVMIFDYRGYGRSSGSPDLDGVVEDSLLAYRWFRDQTPSGPRFILGQSLGGALSIRLAADPSVRGSAHGLVADAAFASYPGIVREKLAQVWLTWPLQYPLSWLVPGDNDAVDHIGHIDAPLLLFHSTHDAVIPYHHGELLYASAQEPKRLITTTTEHTATFMEPRHRAELIAFLDANAVPGPWRL